MRSAIYFLSAAVLVALSSVPQQAEAKGLSIPLDKRSSHNTGARVQVRDTHRRHHSKVNKRAACAAKARSAYSNTTVTADATDSSASASSSSSSSSSKSGKSAASATSSASDSSETDTSPLTSGSSSSGTTASGSVSGFSGSNTGIGSWFHTDLSSDSTNGMSWCETNYLDSWPCFAPSVGTMMSGYSTRQEAAKAYCGREAKVTNTKTGDVQTMFICDGFDDKWVRTPGSIDLTVGAFTTLNGGTFDNNKNTVLQVSWELTGNVVTEGTFQNAKYSK